MDLLAALFRDEHGLAFDVLNADSCVSQIRGRPKMVRGSEAEVEWREGVFSSRYTLGGDVAVRG